MSRDLIMDKYLNKLTETDLTEIQIDKLINFFYKAFKIAELKEEIEFLKEKAEILLEQSVHFQEESSKFQRELELHKQLTNYYINK
jgi:citrate synthase